MRLPDDLILKGASLKDQFFDLRGLSAYSALSISSLRALIKKNGLPCYQLKGKILIQKSQFDSWVERFRLVRSQDLDRVADEIIEEIGPRGRESRRPTN